MNRDEHRELRESLGALALGQLAEPWRLAVAAHVDGCADCRAELALIAPLAEPLRRLDPARLGSPPAPPDGLRESIVARVRAQRRRTLAPRRAVLVAAAAAVVLAGGGGIGYALAPRPATVPLESVAVAVERPGIDATADLVAHTWGTEIKLDGSGFAAGESYRVSITDTDGTERAAGEFVGTGAVTMKCNLNSSVLREAATGFVVRDATDAVVLTSTF